VIVLVAGGWWIAQHGGLGAEKSYKGVSASRWRELANDQDAATRERAYEGLFYTDQTDLLKERYRAERVTDSKLTAGSFLMPDNDVVAELAKELSQYPGGALLGKQYTSRIVTSAAIAGIANPLIEPLRKLVAEKTFEDEATHYLQEIERAKP